MIPASYKPTGAAARRVLVTSALPYANGPIHFGHIAGAYLPADIYVRTLRARGVDVIYMCGTDEHGVAITLTAQQAGVTPRQHVDRWYGVIKGIFERFDIRFDHFSRTSTELHAHNSQEFFRQLESAGHVAAQDAEQLYCPVDQRFLPDRYVVGVCYECGHAEARGDECPKCGTWIDPLRLTDPRCKLCGATPSRRPTRHWYLQLDAMQPELETFIGERGHWKRNVLQFVWGLLKEGLQPRPITRDLDWGVPVPRDLTRGVPGPGNDADGKVIYVWFDAPIGYISATQEWAEKVGRPEAWKDYWQRDDTRLVHFIGKDNIPFHCLTFPAMLMGQREPWKLVDDVPANEFFNLEGGKFNTSAGWYIDLDEFFGKYSTDMIRWAIARNLPETADSEFTWGDFQAKVNGELADIYGNLAHRVLTFIHRYFDGVVPPVGEGGGAHAGSEAGAEGGSGGKAKGTGEAAAGAAGAAADDAALGAARRAAPGKVAEAVEAFRLRDAAVELMNLAREGNRYFDAAAPWKSRKDDPARCGTSLNLCVRLLETLAVISAPFLPGSAEKLWTMLGRSDTLADQPWDTAGQTPDPAGRALGVAEPLFTKIPDEQVAAEVAALHQRAARLKAAASGSGTRSSGVATGSTGAAAGGASRTMNKEKTMTEQDKPKPDVPAETKAGAQAGTAGAAEAAAAHAGHTPAAGKGGLEEADTVPGVEPLREQITIDDFAKCDFRLGRILEAEKVAGSKRLLKFTIDIGLEKRTILAGIQEHYEPESLVGKTVVVIANLAPRRMMGYDSQGMVLAAEIDGKLSVMTPLDEGLRPGARLS